MKGHIRPQGKHSWSVIIDLGRDANGRRRVKWHTAYGTKRDAQRELARLLNEVHSGAYVDPGRLTVTDLLERWLTDYAKINVAPTTYQRYDAIVRQHLIPALGRHRLARLQPLQIQAYYSQALQGGRVKGKGGLSPTTVLQHHRILREALQHALRWQLLGRNPADAVQPPRRNTKEMQVLTGDEIVQLLAAAESTRLHIPILLAAFTGMRRGEILALKWDAIDLRAGSLSVLHALQQTKEGLTFGKPKTAKARRRISLPSVVVRALKKHKAAQAAHRLLLGQAYRDRGLVCPAERGGPWPPDTFGSVFYEFRRRAGFRGLRFHDLRHTHATQLLSLGVHPKVVSERLGHSTVGITLDVYSHVLPGMQEEAAGKIDRLHREALQRAEEKAKASG